MLLSTAFCALVVLVTGAAARAGEAMFRGNPEHTGVYDGAGAPGFNRVQWKYRTQGQVVSSPAIAGGLLYAGSADHNLYALNLEDGTLKWKFETGSRVSSSPAVSDGVVYFGSYDSNFYAVDAASGKLKWKFQTGGERRFAGKHLHGSQPAAETMPDPFDSFPSSPVVWSGSVYFGSGDGKVYSLDAASGQLKWHFQTGNVVHCSPAIADGTLYVGSWDSYFYALDAVTGRQKWRFKTGEDTDTYNQVGIQSSPAVANGVVYFGCRDSNFYAVDAATGRQIWSFSNHGSWVVGSPAVQDGRVYFATSDSGLFHALDAESGKPIYSLNFKGWPMFSSPAIAGSTLYVGSHEGKLRAIDLKAQKLAWEFQTDASRANGPALTKPDGTPKYEAAFLDNFYDDMMTGVAKMLSVGAVLSSPAVAGKVIYFGSSDGYIYAVS